MVVEKGFRFKFPALCSCCCTLWGVTRTPAETGTRPRVRSRAGMMALAVLQCPVLKADVGYESRVSVEG